MITLAAATGVAVIALGLVLTPGPNMIYLVSRALAQGRRAGFISLAGVATGFLLYLVATTAGLAAVFSAVPALFIVVKVLGAVYLLYLAWRIIRPKGSSPFDDTPQSAAHGPLKLFSLGLLTCALNPKIALMYAALLPQFVDPGRPAAAQLLLLGIVQIAVAVTVNAGWVLCAAWVAAFLRTRPTAQRIQRWITGAVLGAFAVQLAFSPARTAG